MRNWITQVSMLQYTGGNVWPEFGLAAFSPSLYKIKSGSGTMRSKVWLLKGEQLLENKGQHQREETLFYKEHWWETHC